MIAHDLHPDYLSTRHALEQTALPSVAVQHHHAHLASCMAENNLTESCLGMIFDGIGYGSDGHIWGGEFLVGDYRGFRRAGHFAYLPMPGADAATREPYRMAISLLYHAYGRNVPDLPFLQSVPTQNRTLLIQMIEKSLNSPLTSSCGRLFDAVAALLGIRSEVHYEGQAALELEMAIRGDGFSAYPYRLREEEDQLIFDPAPTVRAIVEDLRNHVPPGVISGGFHQTLATVMVEVCSVLRAKTGLDRVVLSGGVFQNRFLTETVVPLLEVAGFRPVTHSLVPPNDGGLALGQAVVAGHLNS